MRIAYLILTHGLPDHLGRMIAALRDDDTRFFVHVDRKVALEPFLAHRAPDVAFLEERVPVYWGEWQMVEATLRLMQLAIARADPDYLVLLSGTCYPIRRPAEIRTILGERGDLFLNSVPMPNEAAHKPVARLERYRFRSDRSRLENVMRAIPIRLRPPRKGSPFSKSGMLMRDWRRELTIEPHGGSAWWALPGEAGRYVLEFAARERAVVRFFEHMRSPDEAFFQTVLATSPLVSRIRRNLTYADWTQRGRHPATLTPVHVARFALPGPLIEGGPYGSGELCFARKVPDDGGALTRLIDEAIRSREART